MTTNKPEALDEALIRPGRVDLQVAFTNATQQQARELFVRMYEPDDGNANAKSISHAGDHLSLSPLPPLTPFSSPPPTPLSLTSDKNGGGSNATDVSGATEVGDYEDIGPAALSSSKPAAAAAAAVKKPAPLNLAHNNHHHHHQDQDQDQDKALLHPAELAHIATLFAAKIPDGQFSPAELQGFLLKRKKTPRRALEEVDVWVEGMLAQKASRTRVLALAVQ